MENIKMLCWILLVIPIFTFSQNEKNTLYEYKSSHYYESINLLENGTFIYYNKTEFIKNEISGNWQLRQDSILVLDSNPHRSKQIVFESRKNSKKSTFRIRNMNNNQIHYNLYLITDKKDTIELKDQFDKTTTMENFSSFYLIDSKGQYYPEYKIIGNRSNIFDILIEEQRVFENEYWKYNETYIVPLGIDNKYSKYKLVKK